MNDTFDHHRRQHERHDTRLKATVVHDGQSFPCQMLNVSVSGARVSIAQRFATGVSMTMKIHPFGEFACQAIWQKDSNLGLKFLETEEVMASVIFAMVVFS